LLNLIGVCNVVLVAAWVILLVTNTIHSFSTLC